MTRSTCDAEALWRSVESIDVTLMLIRPSNAPIASAHDVIHRAGILNTQLARHVRVLTTQAKQVNEKKMNQDMV